MGSIPAKSRQNLANDRAAVALKNGDLISDEDARTIAASWAEHYPENQPLRDLAETGEYDHGALMKCLLANINDPEAAADVDPDYTAPLQALGVWAMVRRRR